MRDPVVKAIAELRTSAAYRNYLAARKAVLVMNGETRAAEDAVSDYWKAETPAFDYMLDASPLIVDRLREHCYHLTGVHSYEYRSHHSEAAPKYAMKLAALRREDPSGLFVPESARLGGFGHIVDGQLANLDTLKFYEALIALEKAGLLARFHEPGQGTPSVLEIGGGWGGLAYQFKTLFPRTCYTIVDLPQSLLFSATYLKSMFPQAEVYLHGQESLDVLLRNFPAFDFVFLPHYRSEAIRSLRFDLAVNTVSFQEMSTIQVTSYVDAIAASGCPYIYSLNRDRSPHNPQLTTVRSILSTRFELREIRVLGMPYNSWVSPGWQGRMRQLVDTVYRQLSSWRRGGSLFAYRHIVGLLKNPGQA